MSIITKENGLIGYDNQASQLQIKNGNESYDKIYPRQLGEGVLYNSNTLRTNGRHIQILSTNVSDASAEIEERISQGGRIFEVASNISENKIFQTTKFYNNCYYALFSNAEGSTLYKSLDAITWNIDKTFDNVIYQDMEVFDNDIYMVGYTQDTNMFVVYSYKQQQNLYTINITKSSLNTSYICADSCSVCVLLYDNISGLAYKIYGIYDSVGSVVLTHESIPANSIKGNLINVGFGKYIAVINEYIYVMSSDGFLASNIIANKISNYDNSNNCFYAVNGSKLFQVIYNNNLIANEVYTFPSNVGLYYDFIYVNGKYIYNTFNIETDVPCCAYAMKPYNNTLYIDGKYIINQPLINLCHEGHYLFAKGYNDGLMYYSLVK